MAGDSYYAQQRARQATGQGTSARRRRSEVAAKQERTRGEFQKIEQILGPAMKRLGIARDIQRYRFFLHWEEVVGPELSKHMRPECLKGDALVVRVDGSVWAQELSFDKELILGRVRTYCGQEVQINDLLFYGPGGAW